MRVLYLHPEDSGNAGDKVILEGCKSLMTEAVGEHEAVICSIEKGEQDPDEYLMHFCDEYDFLVVSGTPWIWDMCDRSKKYQVLERLLDLQSSAKKIALGIGSCFPLATNTLQNHFMGGHKEETRNYLRDIYSRFDVVFTRDQIAQICMMKIGVESTLAPCPACFGSFPEAQGGKAGLVFYHPRFGLSGGNLDDFFVTQYLKAQTDFIREHRPVVLAMSEADHNWLIENGFSARLIREPAELIEALYSIRFLVSGRVHAAIPAKMMGIPTLILPVDTRFLTATYVGASIHFPYDPEIPGACRWDQFTLEAEPHRAKIVNLIKRRCA